jgi:hypothetical protein
MLHAGDSFIQITDGSITLGSASKTIHAKKKVMPVASMPPPSLPTVKGEASQHGVVKWIDEKTGVPMDDVPYQIVTEKKVHQAFDKTSDKGLGWVFDTNPDRALGVKKNRESE